MGERHAGHRRHPFPVRLRRPGLPDRQRRRAGGAAHAGGPDRALADVVARRTNDRVHPARGRTRRGDRAAAAGGDRAGRPGRGRRGLNITPAFAPDGRTLAYAHSDESGTDIFTANVVDRCCAQRLTVGRFADNLSPTFSPDGRRIAFVSTRAGPPQIYVMAADGTDQELLAPFDYGATGAPTRPSGRRTEPTSSSTATSSRSPQIFLVDVAGRRVAPAHLVRPQRGSDLGPRRPPHRLHLRPQRTAADLDHRHRNRPGTAAPDAGRGPASLRGPAAWAGPRSLPNP